MKIASEIRKIIEYGTKAPSGHNTQPWKFTFSENEIQIHPDFERALPIVDPDNHALYISLGCSAENIILASRNIGYNADLLYIIDAADDSSCVNLEARHSNYINIDCKTQRVQLRSR